MVKISRKMSEKVKFSALSKKSQIKHERGAVDVKFPKKWLKVKILWKRSKKVKFQLKMKLLRRVLKITQGHSRSKIPEIELFCKISDLVSEFWLSYKRTGEQRFSSGGLCYFSSFCILYDCSEFWRSDKEAQRIPLGRRPGP